MKLIEIRASDFDLAMTLNSGQVFHWEKAGRGFVGAIGDLPLWVGQRDDVIDVGRSSRPVRLNRTSLSDIVSNYFALDHPLAEICASFPDDPVIREARDFCRGLRIIRQPKWECLATFICSSMKQVAHIRQISRNLRERFGQQREIVNYYVFTFPTAKRLAASSERELRKCGLGYRAINLLKTARLVASGEVDPEKMSILSDADLRARLCELPGVGAKVANCVMLFGYERLRAFPIDVWIERMLREKYFPRARKLKAARLREFTENYFGQHGGYAQQYLFHHGRTGGACSPRPPPRARRSRPTKADVVSSQQVR
jgi:N-glycosylase/DNA lyase